MESKKNEAKIEAIKRAIERMNAEQKLQPKKDAEEIIIEKKVKEQHKQAGRKPVKDFFKDDGVQRLPGRIGAAIIEFHDRVQKVIDEDAGMTLVGISAWLHEHRMKPGKAHKLALAVLTLFMVSCTIFVIFNHFTVYEYAYNGRPIGYVRNQETVSDILGVASEGLSESNKDSRIKFAANDNITFKKTTSAQKDLDDSDAVLNKLTYMTDIETKAMGIYENGKLLSIVENESIAENVLNKVKKDQSVTDEGMKLISSGFKGKIEVKEINVMLKSVQGFNAADKILNEGGSYEIKHIVEDGENIKKLTDAFGVEQKEIFDKNGSTAVKSVKTGDILTIKKTVAPIQVELVEKGTMAEIIEYKSIKEETKDLYKGDTQLKQKGVNGKQKISGTVTKINGKIVKRDLKSKEVITEVVDEIILVGITERPKTAPTGRFIRPVRSYTFTSPFGPRWGSFHSGVDLAGPVGTPIYAADGGTVIRAGYFGGYGNCIDIDHGNGVITRYGHNSVLLVGTGEKVYQGQEIAKMGNSGNSTGPHLHFEIRIGGSAIDPCSKISF